MLQCRTVVNSDLPLLRRPLKLQSAIATAREPRPSLPAKPSRRPPQRLAPRFPGLAGSQRAHLRCAGARPRAVAWSSSRLAARPDSPLASPRRTRGTPSKRSPSPHGGRFPGSRSVPWPQAPTPVPFRGRASTPCSPAPVPERASESEPWWTCNANGQA